MMNTTKQLLFLACIFVLAALSFYFFSNRAQIAGSFSSSQKEEIQHVIREYLVNNPEVLQEAAIALQRKSQEEQIERAKQIISSNPEAFTKGTAPVVGNPEGGLVLVEFLDYNCAHCKQMQPIIKELIKDNPSLRVVVQQYPIQGEGSLIAAKAILAADMQGKFDQLHEALIQSTDPLNEEKILEIAKKQGLDIDQLKKEMDSEQVMEKLRQSVTLGSNLSLRGTPFFIVLDDAPAGETQVEVIPGAAQQGYMQQAIDKVEKGGL